MREPSKAHAAVASPVGGLSHSQGKITQDEIEQPTKSSRDTKRRTVQVEYVAPQSQTTRGEAVQNAIRPRAENHTHVESDRSKPLPEPVAASQPPRTTAEYPNSSQSSAPPVRPGRDVPRSVSDSTAFGMPSIQPAIPRPGTGGSMTSAASGARLPSRGSYGQSVAPTVTSTPAQGRLVQPTNKNGRGYIAGPTPSHRPQASESLPRSETQQLPGKFNETKAVPTPKGHRRSSTLSGLGEKLFGRSNSVTKKEKMEAARPKRDKKYPPTSMKDPYAPDNQRASRNSIDSKRSISLGFGKKKSADLESQTERPRRYSFIPSSFSFRGSMAGLPNDEQDMAQVNDFPQPPPSSQTRPSTGGQRMTSYGTEESLPLGHDGQTEHPQHRASRNFSSRNPQVYTSHSQPSAQSNDVYGGTGVYSAPGTSHRQPQSQSSTERRSSRRPTYPEGFNSYEERPSVSQGRNKAGVLQKPRKFADAYDYEGGPGHHDGSSGAARKVMEFFRRRGKARNE